MANKERELGRVGAIIGAFRNLDIEHYPRFKNDWGKVERIYESAIIEQAAKALDNLKGDPGKLNDYLDRGRETLDEVKGLTEYQDQKATRLLTIVTLLSALSGALFSRFVEGNPLWLSLSRFGLSLNSALVILTYLSFGLFVLSAACGALVIFHATRTRFKYPKLDAVPKSHANSHLFYSGIIEVRPDTWAGGFTRQAGSELDPELPLRYLKNYIVESYLVAAKLADKLRYLQPAQDILAFSIRALLVWLVLLGLTAAIVPGLEKPMTTEQVTSTVRTDRTAPTPTPTAVRAATPRGN